MSDDFYMLASTVRGANKPGIYELYETRSTPRAVPDVRGEYLHAREAAGMDKTVVEDVYELTLQLE